MFTPPVVLYFLCSHHRLLYISDICMIVAIITHTILSGCVDFHPSVVLASQLWYRNLSDQMSAECPPEPEPAVFKPKHPQLGKLDDYSGVFSDEFWSLWTYSPYTESPTSWIHHDLMWSLAVSLGHPDLTRVRRVCDYLRDGADIGVRGAGRLGAMGPNIPSCHEFGWQMLDAMFSWTLSKTVCGPLLRHELPDVIRVSPMSVELKPNGKARIICNLSWPNLPDPQLHGPTPISMNDGIKKEDFPVKMVSANDLLVLAFKSGFPAKCSKCDWNDAYKHVHVRGEDVHLQVVYIGGRYFVERGLTFGASSSPCLYDQPAEICLELSCIRSGVSRDKVAKQLDDCICISSEEDVMAWYLSYRKTCTELGVSLASEEDRDKSFPPSDSGVLLGIFFDFVSWTWSVPKVKCDKILILLFTVVNSDTVPNKLVETLAGKICHYAPVFGAMWERTFIIKMVEHDKHKSFQVHCNDNVKSQCSYWIRRLMLSSHPDTIPLPMNVFPSYSINIYPDAAGGSTIGHVGMGGVFWDTSPKHFFMLPWPENINNNYPNCFGHKFSQKLTVLEALAALQLLISQPDVIRGRNVTIWTDNAGLYWAFRKASSKCLYVYTLSKAIYTVARSLDCNVRIEKIRRCSDIPSTVADSLSKGSIADALELMGDDVDYSMGFLSLTLQKWILDPKPSRVLGSAVVEEMSRQTAVLRWEPEWKYEIDKLVKYPKLSHNWIKIK